MPFRLRLMNIRILCLLAASLTPASLAQVPAFSGRVVDASTGIPLAGVEVFVRETGLRLIGDEGGRFSLGSLLPGRYTISFRRFGFAGSERSVLLREGITDSILVPLPSEVFTADEVVVRSTRASGGGERLAYPVYVSLQDELARNARPTLPEALAAVPGISLIRDGSWETALSIRGLGRTNLVTLVDNVRMETAQDIAGALSLVNPHDLERVEIVKAPGSVLFGTGALGGIIHAVTRRPVFSSEARAAGEATTEYGSVNGAITQFASVNWGTERYALRVSGGARRAGDTMTPSGPLENSRFRDFSLSGTIGVATVAGQSLLLSYQRVQAEDTGIPGGAPIAAAASATYTLARREMFAVEYAIPNLSPSWPQWTVRLSRQEIVRNVEIVQSPVLRLTPHAVHTTFAGQIEGTAAPGGGHDLTFGVEAWERRLVSQRERIDTRSGRITGERPVPSSSFLSAGVFAQEVWELMPERFTLSVGARYDEIRVRNDEVWNPDFVTGLDGRIIDSVSRTLLWQRGEEHDASWSANAGLRWVVSPEFECSALLATAFRSPSLEERFQYIDLGSLVHVGNAGLLPERGLSLNVGMLFHAGGGRVRGDVYLNTLENMVVELPGLWQGRSALIKANVGKARLYGLEISGEHLVGDVSAVRWSVASCRGEDIYAHRHLPQIPPLGGTLGWRAALRGSGTIDLTVSYARVQELLGEGEGRTPGYVLVDLDLAADPIACGSVNFWLRGGIRNIMDQPYRTHLSTLRGLVREEPGRNFHLSATVAL